jgi:outer membrane protein
VKKILAGVAILAGLSATSVFAQQKVATINIQQAIVSTKDGQKAVVELQTKMDPRRKELEKKQQEVQALTAQFNKSGSVASEDAKRRMQQDIEMKQKSLQRDSEDAQAEMDSEQQRLLNDLGSRIMQVINKFATDGGYTMVLDISSPQTPVIWASNTIDITNEVVKIYDANAPSTIGAPASKGPAAAPKTAAPATKK